MSNSDRWIIAHASVTGKGHFETMTPCQDAHFIRWIDHCSGIAIVCDGAGSKEESHFGSDYTCKTAADTFSHLIRDEWLEAGGLPDDEEWTTVAREGLSQVREELQSYADELDYPLDQLACTVILVCFFPHGLLVTHIGDGRAAYSSDGEAWLPCMTPYHGEQVGETVFITSDIWDDAGQARFIECRVIREQIRAFALMSDGMERASFQCYVKDEDSGHFTDPNLPHPGFFNPIIHSLEKMAREETPDELIQERWNDFLEHGHGNEPLAMETDDKTMVIALLVNEPTENAIINEPDRK